MTASEKYINKKCQELEESFSVKIETKKVDYTFRLSVAPQSIFDTSKFGREQMKIELEFKNKFPDVNISFNGSENRF